MARQTYCYIVIFYFHHFWEKNKTLLIYLLWICPRELWGGVFCVLSPRLCPSPYHTPATGQGQQSGWAGTWRWPMGHCEAGRKGSGEWSFQWSLVKETEQVLFKFMSVNHALQGLKWLLNSLLSNHSVTQKEPDTQGTAVLWKFILLHFVHHSFSHYLRRSNGKPWLDDGDQQCWLASPDTTAEPTAPTIPSWARNHNPPKTPYSICAYSTWLQQHLSKTVATKIIHTVLYNLFFYQNAVMLWNWRE